MTYTEAAVEILRKEAQPLHYKAICEIALRDNMLSHVGQSPEATMGARLAAMARREEDRRIVAVSAGTFALSEWDLKPDATASEEPVEAPPEEGPPARPRERHPKPMSQTRRDVAENDAEARAAVQATREEQRGGNSGRGGRRRYPPVAEVAFEQLTEAKSALMLAELAKRLAEREQIGARFSQDPSQLGISMAEDNRRREADGRRPLFVLTEVDGQKSVALADPNAVVAAVREREEQRRDRRPPVQQQRNVDHARSSDPRRSALRDLRRRLADADLNVLEKLAVSLLEKQGFHEVRVAKRSKEGPLYTARRRIGSVEVRFAVRLLRGARELSRQDVAEVRKDLSHYAAQVGVLLTPSEPSREARAEATTAGLSTVLVFAGDALAEEMATRGVGVVPSFVVDESVFFSSRSESARAEESPVETAAEKTTTPDAAAPAVAENGSPAGSWVGRLFKGFTK